MCPTLYLSSPFLTNQDFTSHTKWSVPQQGQKFKYYLPSSCLHNLTHHGKTSGNSAICGDMFMSERQATQHAELSSYRNAYIANATFK